MYMQKINHLVSDCILMVPVHTQLGACYMYVTCIFTHGVCTSCLYIHLKLIPRTVRNWNIYTRPVDSQSQEVSQTLSCPLVVCSTGGGVYISLPTCIHPVNSIVHSSAICPL